MVKKRSEEHTSELQSLRHLVCRLLLEKKKTKNDDIRIHSSSEDHTAAPKSPSARVRHALCIAAAPMTMFVPSIVDYLCFFFLKNGGPPRIYTFSLHDAFPI